MASDDWFVPGPVIAHGGRTIRLVPPEDWPRFELELFEVPPSMNDNAIRSHWKGFHRRKKIWQATIATLLMVDSVSREGYQRAVAGCFMRFPRKARRDPGNFAGLVNKALGDALTEYGAIPDDDAAHYVFGGVEFEEETGPARTRIILFLQPKEE